MSSDVDLRELAVDRSGSDRPSLGARRHVLTRYVLPSVLIMGFVSLVAWAARDLVFPPTPVTVVPVYSSTAAVRQEGTPLFKAAGWIEPRPTPVRVAALAPGVVEQLLVVEDAPVTVGQPIAELVKDDAKLAYERARAELELRQAEHDATRAALVAARTRLEQPVHLEAALGEAEASVAKIETELKNLPFQILRAEADYGAMLKVYDGKVAAQGVVAGVDIDVAKSKADAARALVDELRGRSGSLRKERAALIRRRDALQTQRELLADEIKTKEKAEAQLRAAAARVAESRVAVAEARLLLDRMTVVSPIDGRVFRLIAHPGARVGSGTAMTQATGHDGSTVVTLYRPDRLQARVDVRFEDIPRVRLNQVVKIDNAVLSAPLDGKVLFVSSEADIQKNTLQVKVEIPEPPAIFKPEMLVDVTFLAPEHSDQIAENLYELKLYVPQQLIQLGDGGSFVWLADQSRGIAKKTAVEVGSVGENGLVEIVRGLNISSKIISGGGEGLREGDRLRVTGEDPSFGSARNH